MDKGCQPVSAQERKLTGMLSADPKASAEDSTTHILASSAASASSPPWYPRQFVCPGRSVFCSAGRQIQYFTTGLWSMCHIAMEPASPVMLWSVTRHANALAVWQVLIPGMPTVSYTKGPEDMKVARPWVYRVNLRLSGPGFALQGPKATCQTSLLNC